MKPWQIESQGHVDRRLPTALNPVAAGPRLAIARNGDILCSYMVQSKLAINDFVPMLARSRDGGRTWSAPRAIWPELAPRYSFFVNISRAPAPAPAPGSDAGRLFLFGSRCPIDTPGESFWSDATQGLKQNEMIWASSEDDGHTWSPPRVIGNLMPGSAEAPGPLTVTRGGAWVGPYSPYNTFDPQLKVDRAQVVLLRSTDQGKTWSRTSMMRFTPECSNGARDTGGAEAWCIELADGRLLGTCWHIDHSPADQRQDLPNKWTISSDGGATWSTPRSTGTMGHTTALVALPSNESGAAGAATTTRASALFINVRRKPAEAVGIWITTVQPTEPPGGGGGGTGGDFGIQHDQLVWRAGKASTTGNTDADQWSNFTFGEPSACVLPDGTVLLSLWYADAGDAGIQWLRLRRAE